MRRPLHIAFGALLGGVLAVGAAPSATSAAVTASTGATGTAATSPAATTTAQQNRVEAYWTRDRMRTAKPADRGFRASGGTVARGTPTAVADRAAKGTKPGGPPAPASVVATTGKVFFTLGGTNYVCSGSATSSSNRDVVTSAGHCVNEGPGAFATNWAFVPAYNNGNRPYGTWTARTLVTTSAWANQGDINYDGGFAVMNTLNGQHLTDVVGGQGISFNQPRNQYYTAYGYPAAPPFDGQTLKSCAGTAQDDIYGGTQSQSISCNMTGGSSGGPWFLNGAINSLNSFGYTTVHNRMFGPYFGSVIQSAYNTAQSG